MHHRNLQYLAIESGNAPFLMNEIFTRDTQTNFYNYHNLKSVRFGIETLRGLGPKIWNIIPHDIKNSASLAIFKQQK